MLDSVCFANYKSIRTAQGISRNHSLRKSDVLKGRQGDCRQALIPEDFFLLRTKSSSIRRN
jgi:hypothetical protein